MYKIILFMFAFSLTSVLNLYAAQKTFKFNPASNYRNTFKGRNAVKYSVEKNENHIICEYDFSGCPNNKNSYLRIDLNIKIPGAPSKVKVKISQQPEDDCPKIYLWLKDRTGETYLARMDKKNSSKQDLVFSIPQKPAWKSGDNNRMIDFPLTLHGIGIERNNSGQKGKIAFAEIRIVTDLNHGSPYLLRMIKNKYFWGEENQKIQFAVENFSDKKRDELKCRITVYDLYHDKNVYQKDIILTAENGHLKKITRELNLPFGCYQYSVKLLRETQLLDEEEETFQHFMTDCSKFAPSILEYDMRWSPLGGVWGNMSPDFGNRFGARWIRFEHPNWRNVQLSRTNYDISPLKSSAETYRKNNVRPISLQTIYHYPKFYDPSDLADFSAGYGQVMKQIALKAYPALQHFELGNEDNGHSKYIYSEIARNGAAGVRSSQPFAVTANSGTAFIDHIWLQLQRKRGVLRYMDALCVHPYTNNSTPSQSASAEKLGVLEKLFELNKIVDQSGGMKELWNTEFGWPNANLAGERDRAELYLRELAVCDAAGMRISGVYTFQRDYKTIDNPAGISVNAYAAFRSGSRFIGLLREKTQWTAVYEKLGKSWALSWCDTSANFINVLKAQKYFDLFGNPIARPEKLTTSPVFMVALDDEVYKRAIRAGCETQKQLFLNCLKLYPQVSNILHQAEKNDACDARELEKILLEWSTGKEAVDLHEKAVMGRIYEWYLRAGRINTTITTPVMLKEIFAAKDIMKQTVEKQNAQGLDLQGLRYLLRRWDRIEMERKLALQSDNITYANTCLLQMKITSALCNRLARNEEPFFYGVFSNIYMDSGRNLTEKLTFVPGRPANVKIRISSYLTKQQEVVVTPAVPKGWKLEPQSRKVFVSENNPVFVNFQITAADMPEQPEIIVQTAISGIGKSSTTFDEIELLPVLDILIDEVNVNPNNNPVKVILKNNENRPLSGDIKFYPAGVESEGIAKLRFDNIEPFTSRAYMIKLREIPKSLNKSWMLTAKTVLADRRSFKSKVKIDFTAIVKRTVDFHADGNLSEWKDALPLRLDLEEYTLGSYGSGWSKEDGSATSWMMWDENNLYFAARVTDQTFNQQNQTNALWQQDSIQIIFAADKNDQPREFTLALSPTGPVFWDPRSKMIRTDTPIYINYSNQQAIYEVAIPWSVFGHSFTDVLKNKRFLYGIALNDDDAISGRKFLERFHDSIIHGKKVENFAEIRLLAPNDNIKINSKSHESVFRETFDLEKEGTRPKFWISLNNHLPDNSIQIASIDNKNNALYLQNSTGTKPHHFSIIYMPLSGLEPGKIYTLNFRVKGLIDVNSKVIGICADAWGNKDYKYAQWTPSENWQNCTLKIHAPITGKTNLIIRNTTKTDGLYIDDIELHRVNEGH